MPGVVGVDNFGGFTNEFRLDLDPTELLRYGLGINDVINAINNNNSNAGGGRVSRGDQSFVVRGVGLVHNLDDLGNIVVTQRNSVPILMRDLGTLSYSHQEPEGILGKDGNPETIEGIVLLLKYSNASQVLAGIHAKVDELQQATRAAGRAHRSLYRPRRPRRSDGQQGRAAPCSKASACRRRADAVPRQPAQRAGRRRHHSAGHGAPCSS